MIAEDKIDDGKENYNEMLSIHAFALIKTVRTHSHSLLADKEIYR